MALVKICIVVSALTATAALIVLSLLAYFTAVGVAWWRGQER